METKILIQMACVLLLLRDRNLLLENLALRQLSRKSRKRTVGQPLWLIPDRPRIIKMPETVLAGYRKIAYNGLNSQVIKKSAILGEQKNAVKSAFHASNIFLLRNIFSNLPGIA